MATALVTHAGTRFGLIAAEILAGRRDRILLSVDPDCAAEIRARLAALPGAELIDADCAI